MHRTKSKLAKRAHRVATAVERRGVAATYGLHDRLLANRGSRRRFRQARPELDETQERIVAALSEQGYHVMPFAELFPEPEVWQRSRATRAVHLRDGVGARSRSLGGGVGAAPDGEGSSSEERLWGLAGLDDRGPLAAGPRLLALANAYSGLVESGVRRPLVPETPRRAPSASPRSAGTGTSTTSTCSSLRPCETWTRRPARSSTAAQRARQRARRPVGWRPMTRATRPGRAGRADRRPARADVHRPQGHGLSATRRFHRAGFARSSRECSPRSRTSRRGAEGASERNFEPAGTNGAELSPAARYALS